MKPYYEHAGLCIYHGDCRDVLPCLESVDLVLTDPPYGLSWAGGTWGSQSKYKVDAAKWDKLVDADLLRDIIAKGTDAIIWGGQPLRTAAVSRNARVGQDERGADNG